jgi:hypothetical protein
MLSRIARSLAATMIMLAAACTCGSGPYEGDYFDGDRPPSLKGVKFVESEKGDPKVIGCADGQREGFADVKKNPRVAACVGEWDATKSLRDKPTGKACGDDNGQRCGVPADVCAPGWHVCGGDGMAEDLRSRADANACQNAGPGRFNAALSHSPTDEIDPCPKILPNKPLPCVNAGLGAEPVCCGNDCKFGKCKDGVYKGKTSISIGTSEGCGAVSSASNGGVLCCFDGDGDPAAGAAGDAKAPGGDAVPPGGDAKAPQGDAVPPAGDAKAPAGDAKAPEGDAKAPEGDAKAPAGDAKAPAGDAKKADEKKADEKAG